MGFDIYYLRSIASNRVALSRVRPMILGGRSGFFARFIPSLAIASDQWDLPVQEILKLAEISEAESHRIFFDLTPHLPEKVNLLELVGISGRTVSLVTDAMFHFKVACAGFKRSDLSDSVGDLITPLWENAPERIEQLRLEGGTRGGTWAWSQAPQAATATVLG